MGDYKKNFYLFKNFKIMFNSSESDLLLSAHPTVLREACIVLKHSPKPNEPVQGIPVRKPHLRDWYSSVWFLASAAVVFGDPVVVILVRCFLVVGAGVVMPEG